MNMKQIAEALKVQGHGCLSAWARKNGFPPVKAHTSIARWAGKLKAEGTPRGDTWEIVKRLERDIGREIQI